MKTLSKYVILAISFGLTGLPALGQVGATPAQSNCKDRAEREYEAGQISQAITALEVCWPSLDKKTDRLQALRLLALSYIEDGQPDLAERPVVLLLKEDRGYRPDSLNNPVYFRNLVDELRPPPWYKKKWVLGLSGAIAGGVIGYLVLRPGDAPLPEPTVWPPP